MEEHVAHINTTMIDCQEIMTVIRENPELNKREIHLKTSGFASKGSVANRVNYLEKWGKIKNVGTALHKKWVIA